MASTNKTKHTGLPQWEASDKPERSDFNTAFAAVDTALGSKVSFSRAIPATGDLNDYNTEGLYYHIYGASSNLLNRPPISDAFCLVVLRSGANTNGVVQILTNAYGDKIYTRGYYKNSSSSEWAWRNWNQIATTVV